MVKLGRPHLSITRLNPIHDLRQLLLGLLQVQYIRPLGNQHPEFIDVQGFVPIQLYFLVLGLDIILGPSLGARHPVSIARGKLNLGLFRCGRLSNILPGLFAVTVGAQSLQVVLIVRPPLALGGDVVNLIGCFEYGRTGLAFPLLTGSDIFLQCISKSRHVGMVLLRAYHKGTSHIR